ncbi:integral membrane protein [Brevundimonas abyssalis TAR-001]|uniref:Integral membrane protein n=1 Tax=Brevundimonas abyssalis TAR-001 TaxID=1391729 RepID=A0A8E0TS14_9CAUL|nr:integral membrane protein [Brevundimonas abyssalis TAR-001]
MALLALAAVLQTKPDMAATRALPPAAWLGGLYGAVFVVASAYAVPRLGVATTIVLMVAGQMMLSLILDHFGFMGVPKQPITLSRLAGVAMLIGGVLLVRRG